MKDHGTSSKISLIGTISLDGQRLKPTLIAKRKNIKDELILQGYGENIVHTVSHATAFTTEEISQNFIEGTYISHLLNLRNEYQYHGKAIVQLVGLTAYNSLKLDDLQLKYNFDLDFLIPYSNHMIQVLDLEIFWIGNLFDWESGSI